jgi:hypothetical protein
MLLTFTRLNPGTVFKEKQLRNMFNVLVTFCVLNKGTVIKLLQPENIVAMLDTLCVLNKGTVFNEVQPKNMLEVLPEIPPETMLIGLTSCCSERQPVKVLARSTGPFVESMVIVEFSFNAAQALKILLAVAEPVTYTTIAGGPFCKERQLENRPLMAINELREAGVP